MISLNKLATLWNDFWHRPQPVEPLAFWRIIFSFLLLVNIVHMIPYIEILWGPESIFSLAAVSKWAGRPRFNLFDFFDPAYAFALIGILHILAVIGLLIGFKTRIAAVLAFVTLISIHHRNPLVLNSGDTLLRVILFFLIFSPCGEAFSLDRYLAVKSGKVQGPPPWQSPWALRLMQFQFAAVYWSTFAFKHDGSFWFDGTAVYYASRLHEFQKFPMPWLFDQIWIIKAMTWGTMALELALGVLIWVREFRLPLILAGLIFHLGLEVTMNIVQFEWTMMVCLLLFFEPEDVQPWLNRQKARLKSLSFFSK